MANPIVGTGNVDTDLNNVRTAVQNAAQTGGVVQLKGTFSFGDRSVDIKTGVAISGVDKWVTIQGGKLPFNINVPTNVSPRKVTIQGLRFFRPQQFAILVGPVRDLVISDCKIEEAQPVQATQLGDTFTTAAGIVIGPGALGILEIIDNEIDIGAGSPHRTLGMLFNGAGASGSEMSIKRNKIKNVTGFGLDFRNIIGTATIEGNEIAMGQVGVSKRGFLVSGIRCFTTNNQSAGRHIVVGNRINCGFERSAGIRLQGTIGGASVGALVESNEIIMSKPDDASASILNSGINISGTKVVNAGIEIRGLESSAVSNNRISGSAMAAFSVVNNTVRTLVNNRVQIEECLTLDSQFQQNHQTDFTSLIADYFIGERVENTEIHAPKEFMQPTGTGQAGTVLDLSGNTFIEGDYLPV